MRKSVLTSFAAFVLSFVAMYQARAATYYVANSGDNTRLPSTASNSTTPWQTIAFAISQSVSGDSIIVAPGLYGENLLIDKPITLTSVSADKPILTGGAGGGNAIISIAAANVTISGLVLEVDQVDNLYGITTNIANVAGLRITDNVILSTASGGTNSCLQFATMGIFLKSIGTSNYTIARNIVFPKSTTTNCAFGRSIRVVGGQGTIGGPTPADSNLLGAAYSIQLAAPSGPAMVRNNHLFGIGLQIVDPLTNSGTHTISNNRFEPGFPGLVAELLEIRGVTRANSSVNVTGNRFYGYNYIGLLSARSNNVTVSGNTFTPRDTAGYVHIMVNSKQETAGAAASQTPFTNGIVVTSNIFNSAPTNPNAGTGILFADHNNIAGSATFDNIVIGGPGVANTFKLGIRNFIALDTTSGPSILSPLYPNETATSTTMMSPANLAVDVSGNLFATSGGELMPSAMTEAQLFELEDHIQHAVDFGPLGFVTAVSGRAFVTANSFVGLGTASGSIQRAVNSVALNGTVLVNAGLYTENVKLNRSVTVMGTSLGRPVVNGNSDSAIFQISAPNVTISGFRMLVSQARTKYGILASSDNINNAVITDNVILSAAQGRNCTQFSTMGIWLYNIGTSRYTVTRNVALPLTLDGNSCIFGRGFRADGGFGVVGGPTAADSNQFYGVISTQIIGPSGGPVVFENNHVYFQGLMVNTPATNSGNHIVRNNNFEGGYPVINRQLLEIRNVFNPGTSLTVSNNNFHDFANYGVLSSRSNAVSITGNTFTPYDTASFVAVAVNTKQGTRGPASSERALVNSVSITGNNFKAAATATGGIGVGFYNHNNVCTFANVIVGSAGQENTFDSRLRTYIFQDSFTGFSGQLPIWQEANGEVPTAITPTGPTRVNASVLHNNVDGKQLSAMTATELYAFTDKVTDAIDWDSLGYLSVNANTAYVSNNAFLLPFTSVPSIKRAVTVAPDGGIVRFAGSSYLADDITFTKSVTLTPELGQATTLGSLITSAAGKVVTLNGAFSVSNTVNTSLGGLIDPLANNLTLLPSATMAAGANNGYVLANNGKVVKIGAGSGTTNFAVGTLAGYYPLSINDANNTNDIWSVGVVARSSAGSFVPPLFPSAEQFVPAQWSVSEATAGGSNAAVTFGWPTASVVNGPLTATQSYVAILTNIGWTQALAPTAPTGFASVNATGFNSYAVYGEKLLSGNLYYLADTGLDSRTNVQAQNPNSPWRTFSKAIASVVDGDTILVLSGTFPENVVINRQIAIIGNPADKVNKPVINGTSTNEIFVVNARNVTIQNLSIEVDQVATRVGIFSDNASPAYNNLKILDNNILSTNPLGGSLVPEVWLSYGVQLIGGGTSGLTILRNKIQRKDANRSSFGRGIRLSGGWGYIGGVSKADSNSIYAKFSIQSGDISGGPLYVLNNKLSFMGVEINNPALNTQGAVVRGNVVTISTPMDSVTAGIEIKNAVNANALVLIDSNTITGFRYFGILSGHSNQVSITNNILTGLTSGSVPRAIAINTKQQTRGINPDIIVAATVTGNTIIGSPSANIIGIEIANHDALSSFGVLNIGGANAQANQFIGDFRKFVALDTLTGSASRHYVWGPEIRTNGLTLTPAANVRANVNIANNLYTVASGLKTPAMMTTAELFDLEGKLLHKTHYDSLGFLTVIPNKAFVGNSSFIAPFTSISSLQRGMDAVNTYTASASVLTERATYAENIIGRNVEVATATAGTLTVNALTMSNGADTLTLGSRLEVINTLTLTAGLVDASTHNLALRSSATLGDGNTNSYVLTNGPTSGLVHLNIGNTLLRFPVGSSMLGYAPVSFTDANTTNDSILVRVKSAPTVASFTATLPTGVTKFIGAEWNINEGVIGGSNATLNFGWNPSAEIGGPISPAGAVAARYSGTRWEERVATFGAQSATASGFTIFSPFAVYDNTLTGGKTYYVDATRGDDARGNAVAQDPATPWRTITNATVRTLDMDTVVVFSGTYNETPIITKQTAYLGGVFNAGAVILAPNAVALAAKPLVNGAGDAQDSSSVFKVRAANVTIQNFTIGVDQQNSLNGIWAQNSRIDGLKVLDNNILGTAFGNGGVGLVFRSNGIALKGNLANNQVTIQRNSIRPAGLGNGQAFGRALRMEGAYGLIGGESITDSNSFYTFYGVDAASSSGPVIVKNNNLTGYGVIYVWPGANSGAHKVIKNRFTQYFPDSIVAGVEIRNNSLANSTVLVDSNTFVNHSVFGVLSTRSNNVTVSNNTFLPIARATNYSHVAINTKLNTTGDANTFGPVVNGIVITGNNFGHVAGAVGQGIRFYNLDNRSTYGSVTIGGAGALANTFDGGASRFIVQDTSTGFSASNALFFGETPDAITPAGPAMVNASANGNLFGVTGGTLLPNAMSVAQLYEVENKVLHGIDFAGLGFISVIPNRAYVTPASFVAPYTISPSLQRAHDVIADGDSIITNVGTFGNGLAATKSVVIDANPNGLLTLTSLALNTAAGTVTLSDQTRLTNSLIFGANGGKVLIGANELNLAATATVSGGDDNAYVVTVGGGKLTHASLPAGSVTFPIGTATLYAPVTVNDANASGDSLSFSVAPALTAASFTPPLPGNANRFAGLQWTVGEGNRGVNNASLTFGWNAAALVNGPLSANTVLGVATGLVWSPRTVTLGTNNATATGFSSIGNSFAVYSTDQLSGLKYYVDSLIGDDARATTVATNPNTPWRTITNAVTRTVDGDTIIVRTNGTYGYRESLDINKQLTLIGNDSNRTVKPVINGITAANVISVNARNVTIDNFEIRVDQVTALRGINVVGATTNNLQILNNRILTDNTLRATSPVLFGSFAIYIASGTPTDSYVITRNVINSRTAASSVFGRGIRTFGSYGVIGGATLADSNSIFALFSIQIGDPRGGPLNIQNNHLYLQGLEINTPNFAGNHIVRKNRFDVGFPNGALSLFEIKSNVNPGNNIIVDSNQFIGHAAYGLFSTRSNNVFVTNNTFTPADTAPNFTHIYVNSKQRTTGLVQPAFTNGVVATGNTFNGSVAGGGIGVLFGDHDNAAGPATWGTITLGGVGTSANLFAGNLRKFVSLDVNTGSTSAIFPWSTANTLGVTIAQPTDASFNISQNLYTVAGGLKAPASMTRSELFVLEGKLQHKTHFAPLGFLTVTPATVYVATNSFVTPLTTVASLQRGVGAAQVNNTILIQPASFAETVTVDKSITFEAEATSSPVTLNGLTMNAPAGSLTLASPFALANTLTLLNGTATLGGNNLTVSGAGTIGAGNTNSYVLTNGAGRLVKQGVNSTTINYPVGTGTAYTPVSFTDVNSTGDAIGVLVRGGRTAATFTDILPATATSFVNVEYDINEAVAGGSDATINFGWNPAVNEFNPPMDVNTRILNLVSGNWVRYNTVYNAVSATVANAGLTINKLGQFAVVRDDSPVSLATEVLGIDGLRLTAFCPGDALKIVAQTSDVLSAGNVFTAELSDALGSFATPIVLGTIASTTRDTIRAIVPITTVAGTAYRIRVTSSNTAFIGSDNGDNLTVRTLPTKPVITSTGVAFCIGDSLLLTAPTGFATYLWSTGAITQSIFARTAARYSVRVGNGTCTSVPSDSIAVITNPKPDASFVGLTAVVCVGTPVQDLVATVTGGTYFVNGTAIVGTTFNPIAAGTFRIRYSVTVNGCTDTTSQTITVNPLPIATFTGLPVNTCVSTVAIPLTPTVAGGTFSGTGVVGNTYVPTVAGTFNVVYSITVNGCTNQSTSTVVVNPLPNAAFTGLLPTYCAGAAAVILTPTTPGGIFTANGVTIGSSFNPTTAGSFRIRYSLTLIGCTDTTGFSVIVNPLPIATFTGLPATLCAGAGAVTLTPATLGGVFAGTGIVGSTYNPTTVGTFTVTYTVIVNGCQAIGTNTVTVSPLPSAVFAASSNAVCEGSTVTFTPVTGGGTFFLNGVAQLGNSITLATAGTYRVRYSVTTAGCSDTTGQNVLVNAKPSAAFTAPASTCASQPFTLTPTTIGGTFYVSGIATAAPFTAPNAAGVITVAYVLTNSSNCKDSVTLNVTIDALPDASFTAPTAGCANVPVTFVPTTAGGIFSVNGTPITGNTFTPTVAGPLSVTYSVTLNVCTATSTPVVVNINSSNLAIAVTYSGVENVSGDTVVALEGGSVTLLANGSPAGGTYTWVGNGVNTTGAALSVIANEPASYTVTYAIGGCTLSRTITVLISRVVYIPNFIAPNSSNGDPKNRKLHIFGYGISASDFSFRIYNRYGNEVYSTSNPADLTYPNGWDANNLPTDAYNYVVKGKLTNGTEIKVDGRNTGSVYVQK